MSWKRGAFEARELTLSFIGKGGQSGWKQQHQEGAVSVAEWQQKPFTGAHCFPSHAQPWKRGNICAWATDDQKRWRFQVFCLTVLTILTILSLDRDNRYQEACGQIPTKKQSCPLHHVPKHSLQRQHNSLPSYSRDWGAEKLLPSSPVATVWMQKGATNKLHEKSSTFQLRDLWCLTSWLLPLSHSRRPTWVCMATNYIGHLPGCTDLDNTTGYILSEINCS